MKSETLRTVLLSGCTILFEQEFMNLKIEVKNRNHEVVTQYLPMDDHLDYAVDRCIIFCLDELYERQKMKKIDAQRTERTSE